MTTQTDVSNLFQSYFASGNPGLLIIIAEALDDVGRCSDAAWLRSWSIVTVPECPRWKMLVQSNKVMRVHGGGYLVSWAFAKDELLRMVKNHFPLWS